MFTSSGYTGGHGGDAKTIISPKTSFGDIIIQDMIYIVYMYKLIPVYKYIIYIYIYI